MSGRVEQARAAVARDVVAAPAIVAGGFAFGAFYAFTAARLSPWIVPALAILGLAALATYRRPEVGIAVVLVLIPVGTLGFDSHVATYGVQAWSVYLAAVSHHHARARGEGRPGTPVLGVLVLLFLAVALISLTQATDLHAASQLLRALFTGVLLFGATVWAVRGRREILWVLGGAASGALIIGLEATRDFLTGATNASFVTSTGELVGRVTAGFSQPNQLGGFLVLLVPLALGGALLARRGRIVYVAAAVFAAVGVYASFSRGALIGLALVPFIFLRGRRLLVLGPIVVLLAAVSAPGLVRERFATGTASGAELATRVDIWRTAAIIWESHPIAGVGLGGFPQAYAAARVPGKAYLPGTVFQPPPHAHNVFLQLLAEEGILGLLAFLAILAVALSTTLRLRRTGDREARLLGCALLAALVAFLVHNQFDVTLEDPQTGLYVFVLLGLIAAAGRTYVAVTAPVGGLPRVPGAAATRAAPAPIGAGSR